MAWLVLGDRVLATADIAESWRDRTRGVIGLDELEGVLVLRPAHSVHTFGVRFPIDVAYCTSDLRVIDVVTMQRQRFGKPRLRSGVVIEAAAGSFERWGVVVGDELELRQ